MTLEVIPKEWILPNRIGYNKKIYNTFNPSKYPINKKKSGCKCSSDSCEEDTNVISLFPQQRIVRDYMQFDSPYHGILLYHELGSGKSAASIATSEGYVNRVKVFIISPASLAQNYENELMKVSTIGLNMKKAWSLVKIKAKNAETLKKLELYAISPTFIKKDNVVWIPLYQNDIPDAEVLTSNQKYSSLSNQEKLVIDNTITHIIRNRYTFISYNGLTQKIITGLGKSPFDNSFIVIDEIHNFISRIVNGSKLARSIYNSIMSAINCKMVLLSGTPIINNPYEIATLINLIRGPMAVDELSLLKGSAEPTNDMIKDALTKSKLILFIDEFYYNIEKKIIYISLLPKGFVKESLDTKDIIKKEWGMTTNKLLESIIASLKTLKGVKISVKTTIKQSYALPSQRDEFYEYFIDDTDREDPKVKNMDLFQRRILGTLSYYRTTGTEFFPTVLPNSIQYLDMTDHQLNLYSEVRNKERSMDDAKKRHAARGGLFDEKSSVYRAFSRMVCNFAFPEKIKRIFPQDIRKLMKKELDIGNNSSSESSSSSSSDVVDAKGADKKKENKLVNAAYDKELDNAMKELIESDALTKENLQNLYSPKFAKMLEDVEESPGSVLIYSQFRSIEGLGIFSEVLNKAGFKEIVIVKQGDEYIFDDLTVFDEKYDNKRYVIFNADRTKTNILMNLFNGAFSLLPTSIQELLPENNEQLYGKLVKCMMITQSGAEGISLKNVRRVLITEYFWNSVRINQVIGRAVRTCSHMQLPKDQQNVQIFTYIMKFTKKQMEKDFTLRTLDKEMTTDQHILTIATKKENIINKFLNMLKASSFDCVINSVQNKPLENGYKCYHWPVNVNNDELSYTSDIKDDGKIMEHQKFQVDKKDKGKVITKDGKKYVLLNDKIYDYFSYTKAGLLLPVDI